VLLSPTPPEGLSWAFVESGQAGGLLSQFLVPDHAVLGRHFSIPDFAWPVVFFSGSSGLASGAPTAAQVASRGYNAPEPLLSALQLVGAPDVGGKRPVIDAGIFSGAHGSQLSLIAFENDLLIRPPEAEAIFRHLTAGQNGRKLDVVSGSDAVHDLYISDPGALLSGTRIVTP
jgi:hypothetical protein